MRRILSFRNIGLTGDSIVVQPVHFFVEILRDQKSQLLAGRYRSGSRSTDGTDGDLYHLTGRFN
jgi:hypothetical protein